MTKLFINSYNYLNVLNTIENNEHLNTNYYMSLMKFLYFIIVFIIMLGLFYYITKLIAGKNFRKNKIIKIIETQTLGYDRNIHLIELGEQFYLIASTQKQINLLSEISKEDIENILLKDKNHSNKIENYISNTQDYSKNELLVRKIADWVRGKKSNE